MSTLRDEELALEALRPLAREIRGSELAPADAAWIADYITSMLATGEAPECEGCAEHAEWVEGHHCECDGNCGSGDRLEAALWVLEDWPAELAPEMRERMRRALGGERT